MFIGDKIETNLPYFYRLSNSNIHSAKLNDPNQCNKERSRITSKHKNTKESILKSNNKESRSRTNCSNHNRRFVNESNFIQHSNIRIQNNEI